MPIVISDVLTSPDLVPVYAELNDLRKEVRRLGHRVNVGAYTGVQGGTAAQQNERFQAAQATLGPLPWARTFDDVIKPVGQEKWRQVSAQAYFHSVKPTNKDPQQLISAADKAKFQSMIQALPSGTKLTVWHEPENDMPATTFRAMTSRVCEYTREVRNDVEVWYVSLLYQWRVNSKGHTGPENQGVWGSVADLVDGVGIDTYASDWAGPISYYQDPGFPKWWAHVASRAMAQDKKWGVIERGISRNHGTAVRRQIMRRDFQHAQDNRADIFLAWNSDWNGNLWEITDPTEQEIYNHFAHRGVAL